MANIGAVCSGSTLFASILNSSVMLANYLQQTTSSHDIFRCFFFPWRFKGLKNIAEDNYNARFDTHSFLYCRKKNNVMFGRLRKEWVNRLNDGNFKSTPC